MSGRAFIAGACAALLLAVGAAVFAQAALVVQSKPLGRSHGIDYRSASQGFSGSDAIAAACKGKGYRAVGGGASVTGGDPTMAHLGEASPELDSAPPPPGRGFEGAGLVFGIGQDLSVYAMCARHAGAKTVTRSTTAGASGGPYKLKVRCPRGTQVSGGGYLGSSGDNIMRSAPYDGGDRDRRPDDGWMTIAGADNPFETFTASAICVAKLRLEYVTAKATGPAGSNQTVVQSASCPPRSAVTGGGAAISPRDNARMLSLIPADIGDAGDSVPSDGFLAKAFYDSGPRKLKVTAICARA